MCRTCRLCSWDVIRTCRTEGDRSDSTNTFTKRTKIGAALVQIGAQTGRQTQIAKQNAKVAPHERRQTERR